MTMRFTVFLKVDLKKKKKSIQTCTEIETVRE